MTIDPETAKKSDIEAVDNKVLLDLYNKLRNTNTKKFKDRASAVTQTWNAVVSYQSTLNEKDVVDEAPKKIKKKESPGKRDAYENRKIQVLAKENPKRAGSRAHKKFEILMAHDGKTIKELKEREGKYPTLDMESGWPATELRWAIKLGLVKLLKEEAATQAA